MEKTLLKDISEIKRLTKSSHPLCDQLNRIYHDYDTKVYPVNKRKSFQHSHYVRVKIVSKTRLKIL